jgi:flagellar FliL protein
MAKETKLDLIQPDSVPPPSGGARTGELKEGAPPGTEADSSPKRGAKKSLMIYGLVSLIFLGGGVGGAGYLGYLPIPGLSRGKKTESAQVPAKREEMGPTVKLSPLIINLKEEEGRNYLKATVVLEIGKKEWAEGIQQRMSLLTDAVILILSDKRLEDLKDPESKEKLKQELLEKLNQHLQAQKVNRIFFDEFLYQ